VGATQRGTKKTEYLKPATGANRKKMASRIRRNQTNVEKNRGFGGIDLFWRGGARGGNVKLKKWGGGKWGGLTQGGLYRDKTIRCPHEEGLRTFGGGWWVGGGWFRIEKKEHTVKRKIGATHGGCGLTWGKKHVGMSM